MRKAVLFLDWEQNQNRAWDDANWSTCWVNRVKQRTNGVIPMVYVQANAVDQVAGARQAGAGLWVAQYASNAPTGYQDHPWKLGAYGEAMRQYTSSGQLPGYSGYLDLNVFRGDRVAWRKYADPSGNGGGGNATPAPAPAPNQKPAPAQPTPSHDAIDWEALATSVIQGEYGNLPARRQNIDTAYGPGSYDRVQAIVNKRYGRGTSSHPASNGTGGGITVTVRRGDTISAIAVRTGCTPPTRWKVPSGNINRIYPGQRVTCGGSGNGGSTRPAGRTVTVRRGDTLSGIASRFGIRVSQLHGYRSGNPSLIYPGEVLRY